MNELEKFAADAAHYAEQAGLRIWRDYPSDAPVAAYPEEVTAREIIDDAVAFGAPVVYVGTVETDDAGVVVAGVGYAVNGILHASVRIDPDYASELATERCVDDGVDTGFEFDADAEIPSWAARQYENLPDHVRAAVDAIVDDPRFDPSDRAAAGDAVAEHGTDLEASEYGLAGDVARTRFFELYGDRLDSDADRAARAMLDSDDEIDPLTTWTEWPGVVADRLPDADPRLRTRIARRLPTLAHDRGIRQKAEDRIMRLAQQALESLPTDVRDRYGFATKTRQREQLLEGRLGQFSERDRRWLPTYMSKVEQDRFADRREARYATAASILIDDHGVTKAATSRHLGLSTSVIDRLRRERPNRVALDADDPLRSLHPRLREA